MEALAKFGRWCLTEHREHIGDIDGGMLQDKAIELGLLTCQVATEPCGVHCWCAANDWFPTECLRETEAAKLEEAQE